MTSKLIIVLSLTLLAQNGLSVPLSLPCNCQPAPQPLPCGPSPPPAPILPQPLAPVLAPPPPPALSALAPALPSAVQPEVILQNDGQPIVVYATDQNNDLTGADLELVDAQGNPILTPLLASPPPAGQAPPPPAGAVPPPPPPPPPPPTSASDTEALVAAALEDATVPIPEPEQDNSPKVPCRIETTEEVTQEGAETVIHKPAHIIVNQPPTRLVINHPPVVVKPSAVVFHRGGKTIRKHITHEFLPRQIQVRPVIVRVVKPIEKRVLISKPESCGSTQQVIDESPSGSPCDWLPAPGPIPSPPPAPTPAPIPCPPPAPTPAPIPCPPPAPTPAPIPFPPPPCSCLPPRPPAPLPPPPPPPSPWLPPPPPPCSCLPPRPPTPLPLPPPPPPAPQPCPAPIQLQPLPSYPVLEIDPTHGELELPADGLILEPCACV